MKVFVIKYNDQYLAAKFQPITLDRYSGGYCMDLVSNLDEAKHYLTKGHAKSLLTQTAKRIEKLRERYVGRQNTQRGSYYRSTASHKIKQIDDFKVLFDTLRVVEEELESDTANVYSTIKKVIRFFRNRVGVHVWNMSNCKKYCYGCGIELKSIPYICAKHSHTNPLCVFCVVEQQGVAQNAIDAIPADRREEIIKARFLERV